jgi:phosphatidylinositol glycan class U
MDGTKVAPGRTAGLYAGAAVLRLAIFTLLPGLANLLTGRVEVSTPVTSFKRRKPLAQCKLLLARPPKC